MTTHDISMNRHVLSMRRARVRQAIKSLRYYRKIGDRRGQIEAALYFRGALSEYRASVKVLIRNT